MTRVTPFLSFDGQAEEAARFYTSVFKNSRIKNVTHNNTTPGHKGEVASVRFELDGNEFVALNGRPAVRPNEAISFTVECKDQREIDEYWEKLSERGEKGQSGKLKDRYGINWQIEPTRLPEMLSDKDPQKADRVMSAITNMKKIDIAALERAYAGH